MSAAYRRGGFSLLELLVVLSIMAVLAALLLPAINSARRYAQGIHCASNLRQIGQAIHAYRADHRRLPEAQYLPAPFNAPLDPATTPIFTVMASYLPPGSPVYRCPGDVGQVYERIAALSESGHGTSYAYFKVPMPGGVQMQDFIGDDNTGMVSPPLHGEKYGGSTLLLDGSVAFHRGQ